MPPAPDFRIPRVAIGIACGMATAGMLLLVFPAVGVIPATSVVVGGVVGGSAARFLGVKLPLAVTSVLLLSLGVVAFTPILDVTVPRCVRNDEIAGARASVIIALSAGINYDSTLSAPGQERLLAALDLRRRGLADTIVTTREVSRIRGVEVSTDLGQRTLMELGGGTEGWLIVPNATSTRTEALGAWARLGGEPPRRVAVVTSPLHTRRACAAFKKVGFDVLCIAARGAENVAAHPAQPSERMHALHGITYEMIAWLEYRYLGWL